MTPPVRRLQAENERLQAQLTGPAGYPAIIEEIHRALDSAGIQIRPVRPVTDRIGELATQRDEARSRLAGFGGITPEQAHRAVAQVSAVEAALARYERVASQTGQEVSISVRTVRAALAADEEATE